MNGNGKATNIPTSPTMPGFDGSYSTPQGTTPTLGGMPNIGLALLPFTPVPFTGTDALYAWGRLLLYGAIAGATFRKYRMVSYVAMGAAGVSIMTSLSQWKK